MPVAKAEPPAAIVTTISANPTPTIASDITFVAERCMRPMPAARGGRCGPERLGIAALSLGCPSHVLLHCVPPGRLRAPDGVHPRHHRHVAHVGSRPASARAP